MAHFPLGSHSLLWEQEDGMHFEGGKKGAGETWENKAPPESRSSGEIGSAVGLRNSWNIKENKQPRSSLRAV